MARLKGSWLHAIISVTATQTAGRAINIIIAFSVLSLYAPDLYTDRFLLLLSVSFYFYGTLANSITDATIPLLARGGRGLSGRAVHVAILSTAIAFAVLWPFLSHSPLAEKQSVLYALAGMIIVYSGLNAAFPIARLYIAHRFVAAGLSWLFRGIPLLAFWLWRGSSESLLYLILGIALADTGRFLVLKTLASRHNQAATHSATPGGAELWAHYSMILGAASLSGLNPVVDRWIVTLGSAGDVSLLDLSERLCTIVGTICTIGFAQVALVEMSRRPEILDDRRLWYRLLLITVLWGLAWTVAASLGGYLLIPWVLGRWTKFSGQEAGTVLTTYYCYVGGLVPLLVGMICARQMITRRAGGQLLKLAGLSAALNAILSLALFRVWGVPGVAFATTMVYAVIASIMVVISHYKSPVHGNSSAGL